MPKRSSNGKVVGSGKEEKLRARKPAQICKKRPTRVVANKQLQRNRGVIVTMSVEQGGGMSLNTPECVATSHSRKISTTSTLFSPMGVSIGVVCESTTENKEVIVDMKNGSKGNAKVAKSNWMHLVPEIKTQLKTKPLTFDLGNAFNFLDEQQLEKISELNINTIQDILNISLGKLLELKLSNDQLQLLIVLVEKEICVSSITPDTISEEVQPLRSISEEFQKFDANDDDDEKPLVIDETLPIINENKNVSNIEAERSLEAIEECFSKIRNVKVPQTRAALKEVRSELSEIIAELSGKESRILDNMSNNDLKTAAIEEAVTTTSKTLKTSSVYPNMQPTVLIKKLPTPLKKKELNMDADSTTSLDLSSSNGSKTEMIADESESKNSKPVLLLKKGRKRNIRVMNLMNDKDVSYAADGHSSKVLEDRVAHTSPLTRPQALLTINKIKSKKFIDSGIISDDSMKFNSQKHCKQWDLQVKEQINLDTCANAIESNASLNICVEGASIPAKRRIEFDTKSCNGNNASYSSYDADAIVTISHTPLSPISNEIMSPIKPNFFISDYKPALEIDGLCAEIVYLVKEIDITNVSINKPDKLDSLLRSNTADPRLFKYLNKDNSAVHTSTTLCRINKAVQNDPRRSSSIYNTETFLKQRKQEQELSQSTPNMLLYGCLQRSPWYQSLMSTMKIQINQTISILVRAINNFQKIRLDDPYAVFDIFKLYCAGELLEILENLGLFVDVNGVISEKKNMSSYAGRSFSCTSVVNATYSFIQPVEPSSATVQQQIRLFTSPAANFATAPTAYQSSTPFISCYIDSPQMAMDKTPSLQQPYMRGSKPSPYRAPLAAAPRRHCGLKVPYSSNAAPTHASLSPIKRQLRYSDSEEENWDLDEDIKTSTPLKSSLNKNSVTDDQHSAKYANSYDNHKKRY